MSEEKTRILVVDDELGIREGCRQVLSMEGYDVVMAEDGMEGFKAFEERGSFAVAFIDLKMPRMGGLELIEKIREVDLDIVMFVITAYATIDTAVAATKRGAYGYISKPFTSEELLLAVERGVEKRSLSLEAKRLRAERRNRLLEVAFEKTKSNTIISCIADGIIVINRDKQIVLRNEAARSIIPGCGDLTLPAPLAALKCPEDLQAFLNETQDTSLEPTIISKEFKLNGKVYMINVSPVIEPEVGSSGVVTVFRDITALKELESAKSLFVSMVAHEVKRPLGVIEGYMNVLWTGLAGEMPPKQKEIVERSLLRARALRTMVSELMNLTAIETGKFAVKRTPIEISKVLADAVESCREKAKAKGIELSVKLCPVTQDDNVLADRDAIFSVFANIIDNAINYTPENGHVGIELDNTGNYVKVIVSDDGIGMTAEEKDKIFEEFYRARNKYTAKVPGTGLGLSLARRFIEMHQGAISVESAPGKGSAFTVSLPKWEHK